MTYFIGEPTKTTNFDGVTDNVTAAITTSGNCGEYIYTLSNEEISVGTGFISVTGLYNTTMGLQVLTETETLIGTYNLTMSVYMKDYPEKKASFDFNLTMSLKEEDTPAAVSFVPILTTDIAEAFPIEASQPWEQQFVVIDADNDLVKIDLLFSGSAEDWLEWDEGAMTLRTTDLSLQTKGTFVVQLRPEDSKQQFNVYDIVLVVDCTEGNVDRLCAADATTTTDGSFDVPTFNDDGELIAAATVTVNSIVEEFLDYEP